MGKAFEDKIFFISEDDLKLHATTAFNKKSSFGKLDALVLPIKLRFKNKQPNGIFDFEQSISLGTALAIHRNYGGAFGKLSTEFLAGFNVTNVSVDSNKAPKAATSRLYYLN